MIRGWRGGWVVGVHHFPLGTSFFFCRSVLLVNTRVFFTLPVGLFCFFVSVFLPPCPSPRLPPLLVRVGRRLQLWVWVTYLDCNDVTEIRSRAHDACARQHGHTYARACVHTHVARMMCVQTYLYTCIHSHTRTHMHIRARA